MALRTAIAGRLPRVDLPEILLEIAARTDFAVAFTHVSERAARVTDLGVSVCAVLLAEACNTGLEPLVRHETQSLRRDRLSWVSQNYLRDETLRAANARLVAAQTGIPLARAWGGGEVASADGLRFVVPVRTVHAGPNPKYFGIGRGVTYYNLVSDQFTGLHGITVPGTLRDSLVLLAVALEQQTELQPTQIMTDTGAYSDVVFGLFRLLGYRFSPRLADIGGTRFWRIDSRADYGPLNRVARQSVSGHEEVSKSRRLSALRPVVPSCPGLEEPTRIVAVGAVRNRVCAVLQAPCGRALCVHRSVSVHSPGAGEGRRVRVAYETDSGVG